MSPAPAYDQYGRPMALHHVASLCPPHALAIGQELASIEHKVPDKPHTMFPQRLVSNSTGETVAYVCFRDVYTEELERQYIAYAKWLAAGYDFMAEREFTLDDPSELILSKLCMLLVPDAELLAHLDVHVEDN